MTKLANIRTGSLSLRTVSSVASARNCLLIEVQAFRDVTLRRWETVRDVSDKLNAFIFTVKYSKEDTTVLCGVLTVRKGMDLQQLRSDSLKSCSFFL